MRGYVCPYLVEADVGGSTACVSNVRGAFAELSAQLSTPAGRRAVESRFDVCRSKGDDDDDDDDAAAHPLEDASNRMELVSAGIGRPLNDSPTTASSRRRRRLHSTLFQSPPPHYQCPTDRIPYTPPRLHSVLVHHQCPTDCIEHPAYIPQLRASL